jgi:hypothetical protein
VEKQNCRVLIVFWKGCNKELGGSFVEEDGRPFHEDCVRRMASGAVSSDVDPNNAWQIMKDSEGLFLCFCSLVVDLAGLRAQMSHLSASHSSWRRSVREGPLQEQVKKKIVFVLFFSFDVSKSAGASGRVFFHEHDCFRCESCRAPLKGQFVMGDSGFFCHSCNKHSLLFLLVFFIFCFLFCAGADKQGTKPIKGDPCAKCREPLSGSIKRALGKDYHANCFVCAKCSRAFPNNEFFDVSGAPHCERCV